MTTLPYSPATDDSPSRVIHVQPEPGKEGVSTLPILALTHNAKESRPAVCLQPKTTGPCRGLETNYFFDSVKEKCVAFNYGGCEVKNKILNLI